VRIATTRLVIATDEGVSIADVTSDVNAFVRASGIPHGLCVITIGRDRCFLSIAPDLDDAFDDLLRLARGEVGTPDEPRAATSADAGAGSLGDHADVDMLGHAPPGVMAESLSFAVRDGAVSLGSWDAIVLIDTAGPTHQPIDVTLMGSP